MGMPAWSQSDAPLTVARNLVRQNAPPLIPAPKKPERQAKYVPFRKSTTGRHRNVFTTGPFVPPSVTRRLGNPLLGQ